MSGDALHAVIDIGTVTCRLLVAEHDGLGAPRELLRRCEIVNLGVGVDKTGRLQPEAMQRVDDQVGVYLEEVERLRAPGQGLCLQAIATSASRDAENSQELVDMLARRGVELRIITGEQEAAYCFAGASAGRAGQRLLVADIGGGSTELIAGVAGKNPDRVCSFDVGCRRATERFLATDPPTPEELDAARQWCAGQFAPYFRELAQAGLAADQVVAVAGTATTVVSVSKNMAVYDSARVHNARVSRETLDAVATRLSLLPLARRKQVVGLQPERADVIVAGMVILQAVLDAAGVSGFTASECDLLQGAVLLAKG